jgi:hypothetical protein
MIDFKLFRKYFIIIFLASLCLNSSLNAYNIKGKVVNQKGETVEATIYMRDYYYGSYLIEKTLQGNFEFQKSTAGFLLIIPDDSNYVPCYYQKDKAPSLEYQYATKLNNDNSENIVIVLDTLIPISGPFQIYGTIKAEEYPLMKQKEEDVQMGGDSIFIHVFVLDSQNKPRKFIRQIYDIWGEYPPDTTAYSISDLDTGVYRIIIDAMHMNNFYGKKQYDTLTIHLNEENPVYKKDFWLIAGGNVEESENIIQIKLFPNPLERYLNLSFASKFLSYKIRIYDILGNEVFSSDYISNSEENNLQLDLKQLQSGTYYLKIEGGDEFATIPFVIGK